MKDDQLDAWTQMGRDASVRHLQAYAIDLRTTLRDFAIPDSVHTLLSAHLKRVEGALKEALWRQPYE